jgi:glycerate kinase
VQLLEESLNNFASIAGSHNIDAPGAGAAGGFGYMALTFLGARRQSGIETIFSLTDFHDKIEDADLIITGEGRFDGQSMSGKAPIGVLTAGANRNIPVAMVCGSATVTEVDEKHPRFQSIYQLSELEPNVERCISRPQPIVEKIGKMIAQSLIR